MSSDSLRVTLSVPRDLHAKVVAKAKEERRSLSAQMLTYMERGVEAPAASDQHASTASNPDHQPKRGRPAKQAEPPPPPKPHGETIIHRSSSYYPRYRIAKREYLYGDGHIRIDCDPYREPHTGERTAPDQPPAPPDVIAFATQPMMKQAEIDEALRAYRAKMEVDDIPEAL